jgi:hypothetical protein
MRRIETLLVLANLLAFFALALPLPQAVLWMRYLAPIALLIAGAQALAERPRWPSFVQRLSPEAGSFLRRRWGQCLDLPQLDRA